MEGKITSYMLNDVFFPRIISVLNRDSNIKWDILYNISCIVKSDNLLDVILGIQLVPENEAVNTAKEFVNVEIVGVFSLHGVVPNVKYVEDLPLINNLLATLYPYLREKVHSLYYSNRFNYHLPSMNLIKFLAENKEKFLVDDIRTKTPPVV